MSHLFETFRRLLAAGILGGLLVLCLLVGSGQSEAQWVPGNPQFSPTIDFKLCNDLPADFPGPPELQGGGGSCIQNTTQAASPDLTFHYQVPAGHLNLSWRMFTLIMSLSDEFIIGHDTDIPGPNPDGQTGAVVGGFSNAITLGLVNNACDNTILPDYILYESTTDIGNDIAVNDPGFVVDANSDGMADRDSGFVTQYPHMTNKFFDPDGSGEWGDPYDPVMPHARYAGASNVPPGGSEWPLRQIVIFAPGVLQAAFSADPGNSTHPFTSLDPGLGWTMVLISTGLEPDPGNLSPISDFCSPYAAVGTMLGMVDTDADTVPETRRLGSPPLVGGIDGQGTQLVELRSVSRRDADADGIENNFDTCPFLANTVAESPYDTAGPDGDMIDSACDPTPLIDINFGDHDGDAFQNAQDNCPLLSNPTQAEAEDATPHATAAPDGGTRTDNIGDACDPNTTVADGMFFYSIVTDAFCINNDPLADQDGDGWCSTSPGADPDDSDPNVTGEPDQNPDGDAYTNSTEIFMQTDPRFDCPQVEFYHDAWPPDYDKNRMVNILDIVQWTPPYFNTSPPDPNYSQRKDLNADGSINILDIVKLTPPVFGTSCTP